MTGLDQASPTRRSRTPPESQEKARAALSYLLLSIISGFIELGSIVFAIRTNCNLTQVLMFGLAYQAGGLLSNAVRFSARYYQGCLLLASAVGILFHWRAPAGPLAVFLLSIGLQGMRERIAGASGVGTLAKRASRIAGFAMIGAFGGASLWMVPLAVIAISTLGTGSRKDKLRFHPGSTYSSCRDSQFDYGDSSDALLLLFVSIPLVLISTLHVKPIAAGMGFAVGWISYSLAPMALRQFGTVRTIVVGHMGVAICLIAMALSSHNLVIFLSAWFASGFGGGTVFAIRRLGKVWPWDCVGDLDLWSRSGMYWVFSSP